MAAAGRALVNREPGSMAGNAKPVLTLQDYRSSRCWIDLDAPDVRGYVARVSENVGFDLERKLTEWHARGVVTFEKVVDVALIDALLDDVAYLRKHHRDFDLIAENRGIQKPLVKFTEDELDSSGIKFDSIHAISRAAGRLSLTGAVATFLRHVFQSPPCVLQSLTFHRGSQQPAHIDYPYVRCQTRLAQLAASWIPLEDIHPDAGPLAYYPGSHHPQVSGYFDWGGGSVVMEPDSLRTPTEFAEYLRARVIDTATPAETFLPKKGDVLIWHGNLIHEGTGIKDARLTRKSYVTHYTSLEGYPLAHRRADASGIAENGGHAFDYPWLDANRRRLPSEARV
jgi:hypothetical protein